MNSAITKITCDLNEQTDNRYAQILEISDIAKRLLDEAMDTITGDPFSNMSTSAEKVIYQALIMKVSEIDMGNDLIG